MKIHPAIIGFCAPLLAAALFLAWFRYGGPYDAQMEQARHIGELLAKRCR